jgi:hypothetical protein
MLPPARGHVACNAPEKWRPLVVGPSGLQKLLQGFWRPLSSGSP